MSGSEVYGVQRPKKTLAEIRAHMDWWRREARDLRRDRLTRLIQAGTMMDELLDAIEEVPDVR